MQAEPGASTYPPQALNRAMLEAVDYVHAEGWEAPPTLFALVDAQLLGQLTDSPELDEDNPDAALLALVVQELPENILPGSEHLADYLARAIWPPAVVGAIVAQEIMFRTPQEEDAGVDAPRPARLFSGVIRGDSTELTLLQLRPTEEELAALGPFGQDQVQLRGGDGIAPGFIAALRAGLDNEPEEDPAGGSEEGAY